MTEIAKKQSTEVAILDFSADAGQGFENLTDQDIAIPFLKLLQTNSPECEEGGSEYIIGAKAGQFIDSVTKELLGSSVHVIPCAYKRVFNQWQDRDKGGGFKGFVEPGQPMVENAKIDERGRKVLPNGDYLSDTRNHFILVMINEIPRFMLLSLTSTQIKKSKNWMARMQTIKLKDAQGFLYIPAMYSHVYKVESVSEENEKGKWKGLRIETVTTVTDPNVYELAKSMAEKIRQNQVKVDVQFSNEVEF